VTAPGLRLTWGLVVDLRPVALAELFTGWVSDPDGPEHPTVTGGVLFPWAAIGVALALVPTHWELRTGARVVGVALVRLVTVGPLTVGVWRAPPAERDPGDCDPSWGPDPLPEAA